MFNGIGKTSQDGGEGDDTARKLTDIVIRELADKKVKEKRNAVDDLNRTLNEKAAQQPEPTTTAEEGKGEGQEGAKAEPAKPKVSWLERIRKEKLDREERDQKEKEVRENRLKLLLDSDSEDDEKDFDYKGLVGDNLKDFLERIENHVMAENKILNAWNDKDVDPAGYKAKTNK